MKRTLVINLLLCGLLILNIGCSKSKDQPKSYPREVSKEVMNKTYEEIKTPYKYGLVFIHADTSIMMDCPTVFRKDNKWYMTYFTYDGQGYETWIAESDNLLKWEELGRILPFTSAKRWDGNQAAGYPSLIDLEWGGSYNIKPYNDKYWMSYFGGNTSGYERGQLSIGIAYTDQDPASPHAWQRLNEPVLRTDDSTTGWWENKKLYKSMIVEDHERRSGSRFVMYYNAIGDTSSAATWVERIGMATSNDMENWHRYDSNPILDHHVGITGDAYIQKIDDLYVMFYYSAFRPKERKDAFNRFACSYDLVHWTDWHGDDLIKPSKPFDSKYAHKPCVVKWNGTVYHFYTAVNELEQRGIAVATSQDLGESDLHYEKIDIKLRR
jgi:predicted GH43/DUF377 family glycosyl hydrolase